MQILERPVEHDDGGGDAEIDEVGQTVELGAEARGGLEHARDAAVDAVEKGGEHQRRDGEVEAVLDAHPDRGQPGAQPNQRENIGDQHPDRHLAASEHKLAALALVAFGIEGGKHG